MTMFALLSFIIVVLCTAIAMPLSARTDQPAPRWLDQTIYQPNCLSAVCPCDCRFGRLCLPDWAPCGPQGTK
jgi:hypothetical protein